MRIFMKKTFSLLSILTLLLPHVALANFSDSTNETYGFSGGTNSNTQWDSGNSWLELDATGLTNGSGTYTSRIIDALASTSWSTLSWTPSQPYLKELPNSAASETAYSAGNADMSNNVLLMHMNESSGTVADTSGSAHDGSCTNCPTYASTGLFNTALNFDGSNDVVTISDHDDLDGGNKYSFSMWVNPTALATRDCFISKWNSTSGGTGNSWGIRTSSANADELDIIIAANSTDTASNYYTTSNADLQAGVWSHVVVVYDGTLTAANRVAVYVNNILKSGSVTGTLPTSLQNSNKTVTIARQFVVSVTQHFYNGAMDELALFKRALTSTDVANLYKRGAQRLRLQVRSCNDGACLGENFVGPDGSTGTYFEEQDSSTVSLPSASLAAAVSDNRYFQYRATYETSDTTNSPDIKSVTVGSPSIGVLYSTYSTSYGTTDLAAESNIASVSGFKLANLYGSIQWTDAQDVRQQDFDSNVSIGNAYVSVNATSLPNSYDAGSTIAFSGIDCSSYTIFYKASTSTSAADIVSTGQLCNGTTTPACSSISCTGGVLTFVAPHFDSYGVNSGGTGVPEFPSLPVLFVLVAGAFWYLSKTTVPQNPGKFA